MTTDPDVGTGRRTRTGVVAALVLVLGLWAPAAPAGAQDDPAAPEVERIDGGDATPGDVRATAIAVCQTVVPTDGAADRILIARDDAFADALTAAPLAGDDGCILYTGAGDQPLDRRVADEVDRALAPDGRVIILGGVDAVGQAVEDELAAAGTQVDRLSGPTRYETAAAVAQAVRDANGPSTFTEVIVAYGGDWPDTVTAGAYAAAQGVPIVLTPSDRLHPASEAVLTSGPAVDRTTVVGGTAVIEDAVVEAVPNGTRIAGTNRMDTAAAIARSLWPTAGATGIDFTFVNLERADAWTLALAAAPLSAVRGAPQLGVAADRLPAATDEFLAEVGLEGLSEPPTALLMGDEGFIAPAVADAIADRLSGGDAPDAPAALACDPATSQVPLEPPADAERVERAIGDLDGDDRPDHLTTYALADDGGGETFHLHVRLANGYADVRELDADSIADVRPLGAADIGAGRQVAFVVEQVGASTINVSLLGLHDYEGDPCALGRVTIADPTVPPPFPIYSGNGLQCRDVDGDAVPELVARQVQPTEPGSDTYEWTAQAYTWSGAGALRTVATDAGTYTHPEDEEAIQAVSSLDCGSVEAP